MCLLHVQSFSRSSSLAPPVSHPLAVTPTHHTPQIPDNTDVDCFVTVGGGALNAFSKCQLAGEATTDPLPVREATGRCCELVLEEDGHERAAAGYRMCRRRANLPALFHLTNLLPSVRRDSLRFRLRVVHDALGLCPGTSLPIVMCSS